MGILNFLAEQIMGSIKHMADEAKNEVYYRMRLELFKIKRQIALEFASLVIILTATVFLLIALAYFFVEYLFLTKTISFLIIGIIALFIGIIIRLIK